MHSGLPVVAPNTAAMPDIVRAGATGLLYDPDDLEDLVESLRSLLLSPAAGEELGRRGQAVANDEFSVDRMTDRVLEVYQQVAGE
jgi:glycosyltransferase involved in cell wall biosynthesis